MKSLKPSLAVAVAMATAQAFAGEKSVMLDVAGMYCEVCPLTVRRALSKVPGVSNVNVSYERKEALVTFDDAKATVDALIRATANAGYPSKPRQ